MNYRTNNRTKILEYLMENQDRTVSVNDIDEYMKSADCPVNMTTVYRYLEKLEKDGNVIRYSAETGNKALYQYVNADRNCENHLHLKCGKCNRIIHLDCHFMDEISRHISMEHGFSVECRNSVIYGICSDCQNTVK